MELKEAINKIFEKNCLLFLGAGFSQGAINVLEKEMPTARILSDQLDELSGGQNEGNLEEAAEQYIEEIGEYQLVPLLHKTYTAKEVTNGQKTISDCCWSRIYTTNYDNIIEFASSRKGVAMTPVTLSSRVKEYKDKKSVVVHLNGSIANLKPSALTEEFKLSASSYNTQSFLNSEWVTLFRYDIQDADAIFFIGCSLQYDLDIKRIMREETTIKEKCFFIMADGEQESYVRKASRFGQVAPIGLEQFAAKIESQKRSFIPTAIKQSPRYLCFNNVKLSKRRPSLVDTDIHSLYYKGDQSLEIIQYSLSSPTDFYYYIKRTELEHVTDTIIKNGQNNILIHSDLGNGKTLFLDGLSIRLCEQGYTVFIFKHYMASLHREIEQICQIKDNKIAIILENYSGNREIITELALHRTDQLLIVSERTVSNDMAYDWLVNKIGADFYSVDLNVLDTHERKSIINVFNQYGLWSFLSASDDFDKNEFIIKECKNNFRGILLGLLRSPNILQRFSTIISTIKQKKDFYEALVLILASKLFELNIDIEMLSTALDDTILGNLNFRRNEVVRELINFENNEIKVKSSVLAEVLLSEIIETEIIKEVLVRTFKNFDKHRHSPEFKRVLRALLSFINLKRVLNQKSSNKYQEVMVSFFEDIRNCTFCKKNPHYWLQYAILKLDEHDFIVADTFFNNAYSFASKHEDFDTYQIDNHYARYLLINALEVTNDPQFMQIFKKAHEILIEPSHQKDTKYYPFKVAQNYLPFYQKYEKQMKKADKELFFNACKTMLDMIDRFVQSMPQYRHRKEVKNARVNLERIIA